MKIALVVQHADRSKGGAEKSTMDLAALLVARGHAVTVVSECGAGEANGFRCEFLGAEGRKRWARLQDFLRRAKAFYETGEQDVVHAMLPVWKCDVYQPRAGLATDMLETGHLKHPGALARGGAWLANRVNLKRRGLARVERELMRQRPWVMCLSKAMWAYAHTHFALPQGRLVLLPNAIDLTPFDPAVGAARRAETRAAWQIGEGECVGLLVGHNWKLKGLGEAIAALAKLKDPRAKLMVAGRDDPRPYRQMAERLGVAGRVVFTGEVGDPRPLYGAADYFVLPTRRDTFSRVVMEAMAMGLPVITTRQNGACDIIEEGRQGLIVESGDSTALATAMRVMMDDAKRSALAREALGLRERMSLEHHVATLERVYREVIEARQRAGEGARR